MLTHPISLSALIFKSCIKSAICQNIKVIISYAKLKRNMMLCPFFTNYNFCRAKTWNSHPKIRLFTQKKSHFTLQKSHFFLLTIIRWALHNKKTARPYRPDCLYQLPNWDRVSFTSVVFSFPPRRYLIFTLSPTFLV